MSFVLTVLGVLAAIMVVGAFIEPQAQKDRIAKLTPVERHLYEVQKAERANAKGAMVGKALGAGFWLVLLILIFGVRNAGAAFGIWLLGACLCAIANENLK